MTIEKFFQVFPLAALSCLFALGIARALLLYSKGVPVIVVDKKRSVADMLLDTTLVGTAAFWIFEMTVHACSSPARSPLPALELLLFDNIVARISGAVLLGLSLVIYATALRDFGQSWRVGIDRDRHGTLATGGIFAWTRNPIYLSFDIFFIGTFAITGRIIFLLLALIMIALIHPLILKEERFLRETYAQQYDAYCKRTSRYFAFCRMKQKPET